MRPGQALQVSPGEPLTLRLSPRARFDCDLSLTAPTGHFVSAVLDTRSLAVLQPCPNYTRHHEACDCNFLEARNGLSAFAESMGRFCRSRNTTTLTSSDRHMWLRLNADLPPGSRSELRLVATARPGLCTTGALKGFDLGSNVTHLEFVSPGYPHPPAFVRCQYDINPGMYAVVVNVTDLDLGGPANCLGKDSPATHVDTGRLDITRVTAGGWSSKDKVVVGNQLNAMMVHEILNGSWSTLFIPLVEFHTKLRFISSAKLFDDNQRARRFESRV
ncbi:hypothetical protein FOCC_FOCC012484, partial [Frankliniella occidentalis]